MIVFRRRTLWEHIQRLVPACRRAQDARLEAAIYRLMADPDLPCEIEGRLVPHGYGSEPT